MSKDRSCRVPLSGRERHDRLLKEALEHIEQLRLAWSAGTVRDYVDMSISKFNDLLRRAEELQRELETGDGQTGASPDAQEKSHGA